MYTVLRFATARPVYSSLRDRVRCYLAIALSREGATWQRMRLMRGMVIVEVNRCTEGDSVAKNTRLPHASNRSQSTAEVSADIEMATRNARTRSLSSSSQRTFRAVADTRRRGLLQFPHSLSRPRWGLRLQLRVLCYWWWLKRGSPPSATTWEHYAKSVLS